MAARARGVPTIHVVTGARVVRWEGAPAAKLAGKRRRLNVPPDIFDLRDRTYAPALTPLPDAVDQRGRVPARQIRDQGDEGSCTGFAMAAVVNHLMAARKRRFDASPRFLYENARRYDEWKGDEYEGSSIRGAMKGFLKHGVCSWQALPYVEGKAYDRIPDKALAAALGRPLGAYFRVSTSSVNDMQSAIAETGVVLASAQVHRGWDDPTPGRPDATRVRGGRKADARKPRRPRRAAAGLAVIRATARSRPEGGHAFAIVGYTADGFIVQNSWGREWGSGGFALLPYEDWIVHRMDAWVCQLGVGSVQRGVLIAGGAANASAAPARKVDDEDIRGHYLAIRNGVLDGNAPFRSAPEDYDDIAARIAAFAKGASAARPAPLMLFAHGGLVDENGAARKALEFKEQFFDRPPAKERIYPLHFIWHTGLWETVGDLVLGQQRHVRGTPGEERVTGWLKDKVIEAKDETLEFLLRPAGRPIWREIKGDALEACHGPDVREIDVEVGQGGAGPVFRLLDAIRNRASAEGLHLGWHLVGHSAGTIFHCRAFEWFVRHGVRLRSISFIAPAASTRLFRRTIMANGSLVGRFGLHTMPDIDERDDDCMKVYSKSLLYLVSESFEDDEDRAMLGLARYVHEDFKGRDRKVEKDVKTWLEARADLDFHRPYRGDPTLHGSFDDDPQTLALITERILK